MERVKATTVQSQLRMISQIQSTGWGIKEAGGKSLSEIGSKRVKKTNPPDN